MANTSLFNETLESLVEDRRHVYGAPTEFFPRLAQMWAGILGADVTALDAAACMIALKTLRATMSPDYSDNTDDIVGYVDVFRELVGPDMIQARSVAEYAEQRHG